MLRNYFRIALRSYGKNYQFTLINILGMAVGLSGVIVTFLLYDYERSFDKNHINTEHIFRVNCSRMIEGVSEKWGVVPSALGPIAAAEFEGIEGIIRYGSSQGFLVQYDDNIHREQIVFADAEFFDTFSFPIKSGDKNSFFEKSTAIISEQFAKKYFGDDDPIGKQLTIRKNESVIHQLIVMAVVEKIPLNSSFQFDIITQYENLLDFTGTLEHDWKNEVRSVLYVKLNDASNFNQIEQSIQQYRLTNNEINPSWKIDEFNLVPFNKQKDEASQINAFTTRSGLPMTALYGSFIMNSLILLIACFNFTNTSLAYSNKRLKEIGIRRTFGGIRWQIIKQFFTENLILCLLSLILSVEIANTWIGWMNRQWPIEIDTFYFNNWSISINMILLLLLVSLIAGAYPAFYVSKFHPTQILKGKLRLKGTNTFTRILLTLQFGFSVIAVFSGIVLTQNARFQNTLDWGFDKENSLVIPLHGKGSYSVLKNELSKLNGVKSIAGTIHNLGYGSINKIIEIDGVMHNTDVLSVGDSYLPTLGCKFIQGRNFLIDSKNDISESIIVNEKFVSTFNIGDPLNQAIFLEGQKYQITGVIQDFKPYGLFNPVKPSLIKLVPEIQFEQLVIRADQEDLNGIFALAKTKWKQVFKNKPFEGFYMEDIASEAIDTNHGILVQFGIMAVFALFLSITGLYSIVSLHVNKRIKEIGIRKVMGASVQSVVKLLNYEFGIIILIASFIGCIGGYFFMDKFLSDIFTYYMKIGPTSFIVASSIICLLTVLTSGLKIYKVSISNPTDSLRYE